MYAGLFGILVQPRLVSGGNGVDELVVVASGGDCDCEIREVT